MKKYTDKDFKMVLIKMLNENEGLNEVFKDADMHNSSDVSKYTNRNRGFRKALDRTYERLPYSIQAGAGRLPEEKFKKDLKSLKRSGITVVEMSRLLGVSRNLIQNRLNNMNR
jgi:hypothetical protein